MSSQDQIRNKRLLHLTQTAEADQSQSRQNNSVGNVPASGTVLANGTARTSFPANGNAGNTATPNGSANSIGTVTAIETDEHMSDQQTQSQTNQFKQSQPQQGQPQINEAPQKTAPPQQSLEEWTSSVISDIFHVYSTGSAALSDEHVQIESELSLENMDSVLISILLEHRAQAPLRFLIACWQRASRALHALRYSHSADIDRKISVVKEAIRLVISYAGLLIYEPMSFSSEASEPSFANVLLADSDSSVVKPDFITELISVYRDQKDTPTLTEVFERVVSDLQVAAASLKFTDDWRSMTRTWITLTSYKDICVILAKYHDFVPSEGSNGALFEVRSVFGPLFRLLPLADAASARDFIGAQDVSSSSVVERIVPTTRMSAQVLQDQLFLICDRMARASETSRRALLDFFSTAINLNFKKRAMQVDTTVVSSDAFMINLSAILLRFSEPIIKNLDKIDKIDIDFFRKRPRVDISTETKLYADEKEAVEYYSSAVDGPISFISEVFFLTVFAYYYGIDASFNTLESIDQSCQQLRRHLARLEQDRPQWSRAPQAPILMMQMRHMQNTLDGAMAHRTMYETLLCDPEQISKAQSFVSYLATWILRTVDPVHKYPYEQFHLPLPSIPLAQFRFFPESLIEVVAEFNLNIARYAPASFVVSERTELAIFCITFLSTTGYIKNPYLKAKLVEVLFCGVSLRMPGGTPPMADVLNTHPFALANAMHALMQFYIEVENTGRSTQFYDKVNIRFHISQVFKAIWGNMQYHDKLKQERNESIDFYLRFVALLLNDSTYLLDEALSKLEEIRTFETEEQPNVAEAPQDEMRERLQNFASLERQALAYNRLANETIDTLEMFTGSVPEAFATPELVNRVAAMLDYNLNALCGPKCSNLKVKDAHKYKFNPKKLLGSLVQVYLNLKDERDFLIAVVRDERSYRIASFQKALSIIKRFAVLRQDTIDEFSRLIKRIETLKAEDKLKEDAIGEIPDEYLDPLMFTIMENPVILPSSKISVDMSTIKAHLLSDQTDPFNRMPLDIKDIVPNDGLREKIQNFLSQKHVQPEISAGKTNTNAGNDMSDPDNGPPASGRSENAVTDAVAGIETDNPSEDT